MKDIHGRLIQYLGDKDYQEKTLNKKKIPKSDRLIFDAATEIDRQRKILENIQKGMKKWQEEITKIINDEWYESKL